MLADSVVECRSHECRYLESPSDPEKMGGHDPKEWLVIDPFLIRVMETLGIWLWLKKVEPMGPLDGNKGQNLRFAPALKC